MKPPKVPDKETRQFLSDLEKKGCEFRRTGSGHVAILYENKCIAVASSTPSDPRALLNVKSQIRRRFPNLV